LVLTKPPRPWSCSWCVQAEGCVAETAGAPATIHRTVAWQASSTTTARGGRRSLNGVHVRDHAKEAHRADRSRPRVMAASIRPASIKYVSGSMSMKTGQAPVKRIELNRRVEGVRDVDHFIAGPQAEAGEDRHQGDGAVRHGDGVLGAQELRPSFLELGDLRPPRSCRLARTSAMAAVPRAEIGARRRDHAGTPRFEAGRSSSARSVG